MVRPRTSTRDRDEMRAGSRRGSPGATATTPRGSTSCGARGHRHVERHRPLRRHLERRHPRAARGPARPRRRRGARVPRLRPGPAVPDHGARSRRARPVPVPPLYAYEADPAHLGTEFIVMHRVDGRRAVRHPAVRLRCRAGSRRPPTPTGPDSSATSSRVLADLHAIPDAPAAFPWFAVDRRAQRAAGPRRRTACLRRLGARRAGRSARSTPGFAWLEEHWPADEGETVLSWGDARIGNIIFDDFTPVAVLDWEMASLGPREVDLGLDHLPAPLLRRPGDPARAARPAGLPPSRRRRRDATASSPGTRPRDLDWYTAYAAVRHAVIMTRIGMRSAHFGEAEMPDDLDDLVTHRAALEAMLAGDLLGLGALVTGRHPAPRSRRPRASTRPARPDAWLGTRSSPPTPTTRRSRRSRRSSPRPTRSSARSRTCRGRCSTRPGSRRPDADRELSELDAMADRAVAGPANPTSVDVRSRLVAGRRDGRGHLRSCVRGRARPGPRRHGRRGLRRPPRRRDGRHPGDRLHRPTHRALPRARSPSRP